MAALQPSPKANIHPAGLGVLAVWVVWLWANPYYGIWHDARVYLVMAFRHLSPDAYARDVWFMFGSQAESSLFDELYALVLRALPTATAAQFMALVGGMVWAAGATWFARAVLGTGTGLWAAALMCALAPAYTFTDNRLLLTESFVTARPYAMGLGLAGLAAGLRGAPVTAAGLLAAGMLLHPLMAGWSALALLGWRLSDRILAALLGGGLLLVVVGAVSDLPPLQPMEHDWRELVRETSAIVIARDAGDVALDRNLWWLALLLLAGRLGTPRIRRLYLIVAWLAAWALLTSVILTFYYPATGLIQAQLWRGMWLAAAVGIAAGVDLWVRLAEESNAFWWRAGLLISYLLSGTAMGGTMLLAAWCLLAWPIPRRLALVLWDHVSPRTRITIITLLFAWTGLMVWWSVLPLTMMEWAIPGSMLTLSVPRVVTAYLLPLANMWVFFAWRGGARMAWIMLSLAVVLTVWDQRTLAQRQAETWYGQTPPHLLPGDTFRRGDVVYWPGNDTGPWLTLGTAGYAQNVQAIGIVFFQKHALLLRDRLHRIRSLQPATSWDAAFDDRDLHAPFYYPTVWDGPALKALCSDPELDWVVLSKVAQDLPSDATVRISNRAAPLHWYRCDRYR